MFKELLTSKYMSRRIFAGGIGCYFATTLEDVISQIIVGVVTLGVVICLTLRPVDPPKV